MDDTRHIYEAEVHVKPKHWLTCAGGHHLWIDVGVIDVPLVREGVRLSGTRYHRRQCLMCDGVSLTALVDTL